MSNLTESLRSENREAAELLLGPIAEQGWMRFEGERAIQLDSVYSLEDLKLIVQVMEGFKT